jgi:hypothetical protein
MFYILVYIIIYMVKSYKIQMNKKTGQAFVTIPKVIMDGKSWKEKTEVTYKIGPNGEVMITQVY